MAHVVQRLLSGRQLVVAVNQIMDKHVKPATAMQDGAISTGKATPRVSITALGIAQICSWGTLFYSFPQIATAIENDLGWLKSEIYGALTLGLLFSALSAIPIGMAIDKGYGRVVMTVGSISAGILLIAGSQISTQFEFYLVFIGIGFLHATTLYDAAFSVIAKNFDKTETKHYIASLTLWGGFAATIFIPLIELLLSHLTWREVLVVLGVVNLTLCAGIYWALPSKKQCKKNMAAHNKSIKVTTTQGVKWAMKQPVFWSLLLCFSLFAGATTAFNFHLYPMLIEKGLPLSEVVFLIAILGPSKIAGRSLIWVFSYKMSIAKLGVLVAAVLPIVFVGFAFLPSDFWMLVPFAVAFGAATGTMTIVKGIAVPEFLTPSAYGAINGAMNMPVKVIKALAPSIAAFMWYVTNDYNALLNSLIILGVSTVGLFWFVSLLKPPNRAKG
ncbi:MAG: MFS transporter [Cyanobacteria bacterium P01_F01_bin.150]